MSSTPRYSYIMTKEFLLQKYKIEKISMNAIAKLVGCNYRTVWDYLEKYNIKPNRTADYFRNLVGERFGKLVVIKLLQSGRVGSSTSARWECICDCGNTCISITGSLIKGHKKSCGCLWDEKFFYKKIPIGWWTIQKKSAKSRNLKFEITIKDIWQLYNQQNKNCALSGVPIHFDRNIKSKLFTVSIDRIDCHIGYIPTNIQLVHKMINRMKWILSNEEFLTWCDTIYSFKIKNNDNYIPVPLITLKK